MIVAVHLEMETTWRGNPERFENVYHYNTGELPSTESGWVDLANSIKNTVDNAFAPSVNFKQARIHGPTNTTPLDDKMLAVVDLSGSGIGPVSSIPKELCVVAQWYLGRSARGYKRFLRKYWHTCGLLTSAAGAREGNEALPVGDIDHFKNIANEVKNVLVGANQCNLVAPNGDALPAGTDAQILPHLHVRQFRR